MNCSRMKKRLLPVVVLAMVTMVAADAMADGDTRERQAVHHLQLQLRATQQQNDDLSAQIDTLKKQVTALQAKRAELERKLDGQSKAISELSNTQASDKQQFSELSEKYRVLEQKYGESGKELQQTQVQKEQEATRLNGKVEACERKNAELYELSVKLMEKYRSKGVMDALLQKEPFTQIEKVRMENLLQEYRDKADANRSSEGSKDPGGVQRP